MSETAVGQRGLKEVEETALPRPCDERCRLELETRVRASMVAGKEARARV